MKRYLFAVVFALCFSLFAGCVTKEQTTITPAKAGEKTTVFGKSIDKANDTACAQYLSQLQGGVQMYQQSNDGAMPPDFNAVCKAAGFTASMLGECKFQYDPQTGRVSLAR